MVRTDCVPIFRFHRLCLSAKPLRTEKSQRLAVQHFEPYKVPRKQMQTFRPPVSFYGQFSELPVPVMDSIHGVLPLPASRNSLGEAAKFSNVPSVLSHK